MKEAWQQELAARYGMEPAQISRFQTLLEQLIAQGDRGLTAVSRPESIYRVHFLDSLWLLNLPEIRLAGSVVDIGSGAGLPGLPLAIALPATRVTMLEANHRKSAFIAAMIGRLGLANASVLAARAEDAGRTGLREAFDVALARAVGSLPEVLEYALPLIGLGGHALLQRGAREKGDDAAARAAAAQLGGELLRIEKAQPYPEASDLHIWVWKKAAATPDRYPRRAGMPRKRPLK